jgi:hypothetical protein
VRHGRLLAVGAAGLAGIAIGLVPNLSTSSSPPLVNNHLPSAPFPKNARGETYGSGMGLNQPDLIRASGEGNRVGYVRSTDLLNAPASKTRFYVPLYAQDGVTKIGRFLIVPATHTFDVPVPPKATVTAPSSAP